VQGHPNQHQGWLLLPLLLPPVLLLLMPLVKLPLAADTRHLPLLLLGPSLAGRHWGAGPNQTLPLLLLLLERSLMLVLL
jgi:hypothetical protein